MNDSTEYSYREALKSFDGWPDGNLGNGGHILLRKILKIAKAEGISQEQVAEDIAKRVEVSRDEALKALSRCHRHERVIGLPVPAQTRLRPVALRPVSDKESS